MSSASAVTVPRLPDPLLPEAYEMAATKSVLAAVNNKVFFGYFSVCADGQGHGEDSTFPGLDWGQSAEALLWLGREDIIRASWDYVKSFQRADGYLPFAILPSQAGQTTIIDEANGYKLVVEPNGAVFKHWFPGDPLRTLAPVTYLMTADAIFRHTLDRTWLAAQADSLRRAATWLEGMIDAEGKVGGGGFYVERPTRLEFDGVTQGCAAHAFGITAGLLEVLGEKATASHLRALAQRVIGTFQTQFWDGDQFIEYIHPERGRIKGHGLTDVDWAALATGAATREQAAVLWPRLRDTADFVYSGIPTGIATRPETYEDWEMSHYDRHDLAAMGRVWYIESRARAAMGDGDGLAASLRKVAEKGRDNNWSWWERYYSERTGDLAKYHYNTYVEYPACLVRIVNQFLLGIRLNLDGSLRLAPNVPADFWEAGFGHEVAWAGRKLAFAFKGNAVTGTYAGPEKLRLAVRFRDGKEAEVELPASAEARAFEVKADRRS